MAWGCDRGTLAPTDSLKLCTALTTLDLRWTQIGDFGTAFFAASLKFCTALTHLNLCTNQIGDSGTGPSLTAFHIAPSSPTCTSLTTKLAPSPRPLGTPRCPFNANGHRKAGRRARFSTSPARCLHPISRCGCQTRPFSGSYFFRARCAICSARSPSLGHNWGPAYAIHMHVV